MTIGIVNLNFFVRANIDRESLRTIMSQSNRQNLDDQKAFQDTYPLCYYPHNCKINCFNNNYADHDHDRARKHSNRYFHMRQQHYNQMVFLMNDVQLVFGWDYLSLMYDQSTNHGVDKKNKYGVYVHKNDYESNHIIKKAKYNKTNLGKMILEMYFNADSRLCYKMYDRTNVCDCSNIHLTNNGIIHRLESECSSKNNETDDIDALLKEVSRRISVKQEQIQDLETQQSNANSSIILEELPNTATVLYTAYNPNQDIPYLSNTSIVNNEPHDVLNRVESKNIRSVVKRSDLMKFNNSTSKSNDRSHCNESDNSHDNKSDESNDESNNESNDESDATHYTHDPCSDDESSNDERKKRIKDKTQKRIYEKIKRQYRHVRILYKKAKKMHKRNKRRAVF
jgi:hypothetical protein